MHAKIMTFDGFDAYHIRDILSKSCPKHGPGYINPIYLVKKLKY